MSVVLRLPFLLGLSAGLFGTLMMVPAKAEPAVPVHVIGAEAWSYMSQEQRRMVDIVARDMFEQTLSPAQRTRITGAANGRYDDLPDWRKAPFRGAAIRQLGHAPRDFRRNAI